jgi:16S rRNA processing protein RimM
LDEFYLIAEVDSIFDQEGSVIIKSFSDFSERFNNLEKVYIEFIGSKKVLDVEFSKIIDDLIILKFRRFNSEEDVHFLIGKKLYVPEEDLQKLPEDTYYIHDIINSNVFLNSSFFGKLVDILLLPGNDVYVIRKENGKEIMIPAVKEYIQEFDSDKKILILHPECRIFNEDEN